MSKTLKGQIATVLMCSLPISMLIISQPGDFIFFVIDGLRLVIPLIVFCVFFGRMKTGKGVDFKLTRIVIASILWILIWRYQVYFELDKYFDIPYRWHGRLIFCYDAVTLILTVILSYYVGKLINSLFAKLVKNLSSN